MSVPSLPLRLELPNRWVALAFMGVVLVAGANLVAVRFTNEEVPPFFGAGLRFGVAGVILLTVAVAQRVPLPKQRELAGTMLYGLLSFGGAMALGYWALVELPAGVAALIVASVPVLTLFLARLQGLEPFRWRGLSGGVLTIAGIWTLLAGSGTASVPIGSALAMVGAALCLAEAAIVIKKFPPCHPMVSNGLAMSVGALVLLIISAASEESWALPTGGQIWAALSFMVLIGSIGLFALYLFVLQGWTASGASYQFVLIPFVAALLGSLFLDEPISGRFAGGGLIVLLGVYIGALSSGRAPSSSTPHQEAMAQRCSTT